MNEQPKIYEKLCNMRTKGFHVLLETDPSPGKNYYGEPLPPSGIKAFIAVSNTLPNPSDAIQKLTGTAFLVSENFSVSESAEKVFSFRTLYYDNGEAVHSNFSASCDDEEVEALRVTQQFALEQLTQVDDDPRNVKHDWVAALTEITQLFDMHYTHKISLEDIVAFCETAPHPVTKTVRRI